MRCSWPLALSLCWTLGWSSVSLPVWAQEVGQESSLAWVNAYAAALERQTDVVITGDPLSVTLTRLELAQWLTEFFGYVPNPHQVQVISDLEPNTPDYWTAQAVLQAGAMRLFEGNQFRPQGDLTQLEALAILVRALQLPAPSQADIEAWMALYTDAAEVPEVGRPFIAMAGQAGLLVNVPDPARLNPNRVLRRGEGAVLLHQALAHQGRILPLDPPVAQLRPLPEPAAATTRPEIFQTRITPESGVVPAGGTLTIEAQATPNGSATVDIGGLVQGLPMQEVQPGYYRAVYSLGPQDSALSPDISIQLTVNGVSTRVQRRQPQLVLGDVAPPPVESVFSPTTPQAPQPDLPVTPSLPSTASGAYPRIEAIRLDPQRNLIEGDILTIAIWADSGGIAQFDLGNLALNQPMREVRPNHYEGTYVVAPTHQANNPLLRIVLTKNGLSQEHREILPFSIDGSEGTRSTIQPVSTPIATGLPQIFSVTTNSNNLRMGEILKVTMRGDPGGRAAFRIVGVTPEIEMREIAPGLYETQQQLPFNMQQVNNGTIEVILQRGGQQTTQTSPSPITISP
ncbi:S-layer protein [Thermostichus vulcanus]|uniref:S-layer protein n=1 Tax=Thermostichus vulcanus str. 'Rupite' TaxID=2813851 RepID=A0ABT0C888_THEVL|nr:S-layer protein [Thermostichus vulcanus]MCJ2542011.1 S-layer protein [Thermostichus vulcanus str. 'Rupite']